MSVNSLDFFERVRLNGNPLANNASVVVAGNARFTVLTSRLIRLEWSATGVFEDRGTFAFPHRFAEVPIYTTRQEGETVIIDTGVLILRHTINNGKFSPQNLAITFELGGRVYSWTPGTPDVDNLRGTLRTLDGCAGDAALQEGIISRAGWAVFDESTSVRLNPEDSWVEARSEHDLQDWYFFGYGHDYKSALGEYTQFGGKIPLIPQFVLGSWWSRYWAYSEQDLKNLVQDFKEHEMPLDVLVIDMDWHTPDHWTGYTWNTELFPDPPAFLRWAHSQGIRTTLNLHPAGGVQKFEKTYQKFAEALGVDPESGEPIPFSAGDKHFVQHYFELLHHPLEEDGVDFWWLDWQQGIFSNIPGLDPLIWLNHLHFVDSARRGLRPLLYSRWGGLGNHRYQIGFSGDTLATWGSLQFQPYMTAAASNVLYGWWSHDIGGHIGATEPELYARWVQYGALSPCLRLHSTKDPLAERRPWAFPEEVFLAAKAAFHLRYQLVPYLYTMAREAFDTGISLCRPMYYEYPEFEDAYTARYQYFFGDQIIAAPIVTPANPHTGMASIDVWIPPGTWTEYTTGELFIGPKWVRLVGDLRDIPMLMKSGAILPLAPLSPNTDSIPRDHIILSIFPGEYGAFRLYEDDATTESYLNGQVEWTLMTMRTENSACVVEIAPVEGECATLPRERGYTLMFLGANKPQQVFINDQVTEWQSEDDQLCIVVNVPPQDKRQPLQITLVAEERVWSVSEAHNQNIRLYDVKRLLGREYARFTPETILASVLSADEAGRADAIARLGGPFVHVFEFRTPEEAALQIGRVLIAPPADGSMMDVDIEWHSTADILTDQRIFSAHQRSETLMVNSPYTFTDDMHTLQWEVDVKVRWRGETFTHHYASKLIRPVIYAWRALAYVPGEEPFTYAELIEPTNQLHTSLHWWRFAQHKAAVENINDPFKVDLTLHYHQQFVRPGEPLTAYAVTFIDCPDDREAIFEYWANGSMKLYLNGQPLEVSDEKQPSPIYSQTRVTQRTIPVTFGVGANMLVAVLEREPTYWRWSFSAAILTPDGELMRDLHYHVDE